MHVLNEGDYYKFSFLIFMETDTLSNSIQITPFSIKFSSVENNKYQAFLRHHLMAKINHREAIEAIYNLNLHAFGDTKEIAKEGLKVQVAKTLDWLKESHTQTRWNNRDEEIYPLMIEFLTALI